MLYTELTGDNFLGEVAQAGNQHRAGDRAITYLNSTILNTQQGFDITLLRQPVTLTYVASFAGASVFLEGRLLLRFEHLHLQEFPFAAPCYAFACGCAPWVAGSLGASERPLQCELGRTEVEAAVPCAPVASWLAFGGAGASGGEEAPRRLGLPNEHQYCYLNAGLQAVCSVRSGCAIP